MYNPVNLSQAINIVAKGGAKKVSLDNVTVYRVKDIIRIDIKEPVKDTSKEE